MTAFDDLVARARGLVTPGRRAVLGIVGRAVADLAARGDRTVIPVCWYVSDWFAEHPEHAGMLHARGTV